MPGGRGRPKRSCKVCKPCKFAGNAWWRHRPTEIARRSAADDAIREAMFDRAGRRLRR